MNELEFESVEETVSSSENTEASTENTTNETPVVENKATEETTTTDSTEEKKTEASEKESVAKESSEIKSTEKETASSEKTEDSSESKKDKKNEIDAEDSEAEVEEKTEKELEEEDADKKKECEHIDEDGDGFCDLCGEEMEVEKEVEKKKKTFKVEFVDGIMDQVFATIEVEEGGSISEDSLPTAPEHEGYEFKEFEGSYSDISSDVTVTAIYEKKIKEYTLDLRTTLAGRAEDSEGNLLKDSRVVVTINGNVKEKMSDANGYYNVRINEDGPFEGTVEFYDGDEVVNHVIIHS